MANPEREWSLKLDQKIFELAIDDLVHAARGYGKIDHTSVRWSVRIKESDFYGRWETFDARQQVMLLDFTSEVSAKIDEEFASHVRKHNFFYQRYVSFRIGVLSLSKA